MLSALVSLITVALFQGKEKKKKKEALVKCPTVYLLSYTQAGLSMGFTCQHEVPFSKIC